MKKSIPVIWILIGLFYLILDQTKFLTVSTVFLVGAVLFQQLLNMESE